MLGKGYVTCPSHWIVTRNNVRHSGMSISLAIQDPTELFDFDYQLPVIFQKVVWVPWPRDMPF